MTPEDDTSGADSAQELADFDSGFAPVKVEKPTATATTPPVPAATPRETPAPAPKPEYVRITKADWADVKAAAAKTASYDQQLSKAFGTIGNLQKTINALQTSTPRGIKVEIPKDAFADMERDFPELAQQNRAAMERALSGITGTGSGAEFDESIFERLLAKHTSSREVKTLAEMYPDWQDIVGAVDITMEQPNGAHPFRKWLAGKDAAYQTRINSTESAAVVGRAIEAFQRETATTAPKPSTTAADARRAVIAGAVQPRGDGAAPAASGKTEQEEFTAGYNSR